MMSSENIPPPSQPPDNNHTTTTKKPTAAQKPSQEEQQQPPLKCPRCDSANTKFCYYNNYSLTQPRHFCKTCRRYWTRGGALRNVPIGGGCRKTKRHKPSPSSSCPTPSSTSLSAYPGGGAEFRFLGPPTVAPAMEFQLGGLSLPRLHPATAGVYTQFIASSGAHSQSLGVGPGTGGCFSLDLLGLGTYPPIPNSRSSPPSNALPLSLAGSGVIGGGGGGGDHTLSISSIESLSSINQEMHWRLQQQRLALIYGPSSVNQDDNQQEKSSLTGGFNLFKSLESSKKVDVAACPTEWLFDQIQTHSSANYGATADNDIHNHNHTGITTSCNNNNHEDFNGVWTTDLHQHHHQHQHQFNGLQ